ncbi:MAG: hypothetical protein JXA22_04445 [Candidatus Thermoplasmatota archaeon]|nr:hypothetical protein [Candidatus Thermoplasmatota archaeon]
MTNEKCPICGETLYDHKRYLYCYRCSKQFKRRLLGGGLKETENTLQRDQKKTISGSR